MHLASCHLQPLDLPTNHQSRLTQMSKLALARANYHDGDRRKQSFVQNTDVEDIVIVDNESKTDTKHWHIFNVNKRLATSIYRSVPPSNAFEVVPG